MSQKQVVSETTHRYETVVLSMEWMRIMQRMDEFKDLSHSELVKKAADDIARKLITEQDIAKYRKTVPAVAAPVEKKPAMVIVEEEEEEEEKKTKKKK